jgi:hypothetical protein
LKIEKLAEVEGNEWSRNRKLIRSDKKEMIEDKIKITVRQEIESHVRER